MSDPEGLDADERRRDALAGPPRPAAAGHLVGRAEASTTKVESRGDDLESETTLTFRLLGPDGQGRATSS